MTDISSINQTCPWSGKPVSPDSLTTYADEIVGFCNPGCRDKFATAVAHFEAARPRVARSLLQIGGAVRVVATYADSVLVVIDAQEEYRSGILRLDGIDAAAAALAVLLERARQAGTPVIHIVQRGRPGGLFDPGSTGAILPEATPVAGEAVVEKPLPNSFAGTDLQVRLQATGRTTLLLAGFMTHMCVSATARAALDLGWRTTVIADTTATRALPDPLGGADIPAESVHRTALAELADRYAVVARLDEIR